MKLYNMHIEAFADFSADRPVIAFGAGNMLRDFIHRYRAFQFEKRIRYAADNNKTLAGGEFHAEGAEIPIALPECISHIEGAVLLISCMDYVNVYQQLERSEELRDTPCLITVFIDIETKWKEDADLFHPKSMRLTGRPMIPKKIHYCWFGKNDIPSQCRLWMDSWKRFCPDYEIVRWDESNYDVTKNKYMKKAYECGVWAYASDYARLDILFREGGIFLDTDVELVRSLDDLLYQPAFAGIEASGNINAGLGLGAVAGHEMTGRLHDIYETEEFINNGGGYGMKACPAVQRRLFDDCGYIHNGRYQVINGMTIYPEVVLSGMNSVTGAVHITDYTYAIHHYAGTWISKQRREDQDRIKELYRNIGHE